MKSILKIAVFVILTTIGLFGADENRSVNIPQDWPEECIPEVCKESMHNCASYASSSPCHKINQRSAGRPFHKDTNIWDVTPEFGKKYGMEEEYIDPELSGIEAVSYRLENSWLECGYGGKADSCMQHTQGILEIYVDENKTPLPWFHPKEMADWHANYTSAVLLRTRKLDRDNYPYSLSEQMVINKLTKGSYKLRPFADLQTKHEAMYFQELGDKYGINAFVPIHGYKRYAIDGLTVISFFYQVQEDGENRNKPRTFRLVSDFDQIYGRIAKNAQIFHTFYIPAGFIQQIIKMDKTSKEKNNAFFKQLFEQMKNK